MTKIGRTFGSTDMNYSDFQLYLSIHRYLTCFNCVLGFLKFTKGASGNFSVIIFDQNTIVLETLLYIGSSNRSYTKIIIGIKYNSSVTRKNFQSYFILRYPGIREEP